jgi:hypothetical protein
VFVSVLALGFQREGGLLFPYRVVYELLPGWEGIRTPGRLITFSSLGLALLAAAGTELATRAGAARTAARGAATAVAALCVLAVLIEGRGIPFDPFDDHAQPRAPEPPADISGIAAPQLHLPAERPEDNRRYLLWSTDGFPEIVNGRSSTNPAFTARVIERARGFPDPASVAYLRRLGVRSVVLHPRRARGTAWERAARRPVRSLGVARRSEDAVIAYEIRSPGASAGSGPGSPRPASSERRSR